MTITHKGHPLFFVDQLSSHTWLPRRPQLFTDVLATAVAASAPALPRRPGQQYLRHGIPASSTSATAPRPLLSALLPAAASRCCRIVFHAGPPAERQLFRTDFRFAPSLPQRFACGHPPIHEGHGRPRSVRKSSRLRWKCLSMDCICSNIANLSAQLHRLPTPPPYLRPMRLLHGRGAGVGFKMRLSPARAQVLDGK